jgi:hypothetical protein
MSTFKVSLKANILTLIALQTGAMISWTVEKGQVTSESNRGDEGPKEGGYMAHIRRFVTNLLSEHINRKPAKLQIVEGLLTRYADVPYFRTLSNGIRRDAYNEGLVPALYFFEGASRAWREQNEALRNSGNSAVATKAKAAKAESKKPVDTSKPAKKAAPKATAPKTPKVTAPKAAAPKAKAVTPKVKKTKAPKAEAPAAPAQEPVIEPTVDVSIQEPALEPAEA